MPTPTPRKRAIRHLIGALMVGAAAAVAVPAAAEAPTVEEIATTDISCSIPAPRAVVKVNATITTDSADVAVFVITPKAFYGPDFEQVADLEATADGVTGTIPMLKFGADGVTPAGDAVVTLTFAPDGDPEQISEQNKPNSNETSRVVGTVQPLTVTGSVTAVGRTASDLSGCEAERIELTTRATNPDSVVSGIRGGRTTDAHCSVGSQGYLSFAVDGKDVDGAFVVTGPKFVNGEVLEARWRPPTLSGTFQSFNGKGKPIGTSSAKIVRGELIDEFRSVDTLGPFRRMYSVTAYEATGTLQLPSGQEHALQCELLLVTGHAALHSPSGPTPANDAASDATPLAVGDVAEQRTGGAREDAEVGSWCGETGLSYTVWYSVTGTGTGDKLTLDTAGSDFDTVAAVYTGSPDDPREIACNSDRRNTRLAAVTWQAEPGEQYWVQIGGSEGQSGRLSVTLTAP